MNRRIAPVATELATTEPSGSAAGSSRVLPFAEPHKKHTEEPAAEPLGSVASSVVALSFVTHMRIVIAPDKFKGTLSAIEAAQAMAIGIGRTFPEAQCELCPMADGGEGTVAALVASHRAAGHSPIIHQVTVTGPLPERRVLAEFAMLDGSTAVLEMAAASGLWLVPMADRSPLGSTTFGTGELIAAAIRAGARRVFIGLGGSATMDGGIGCLQAMGFTVLLRSGETPSPTDPLCGRDLNQVLTIKHGRGEISSGIELIALTDVRSPLTGPTGAARMFGPQKGATASEVAQTDIALAALAERSGKTIEAAAPGSGAAGGLGFGLHAFANARIEPGALAVANAIGLAQRIATADLCITGEGKLDESSKTGKVVGVVGEICQSLGVACVALVGIADLGISVAGVKTIHAVQVSHLPPPDTKEQAIGRLADLAVKVMRQRIG